MERPNWAPPGIDLDKPSIARVYDHFLGGFHNFTVDREVVEEALRILPESPLIAQTNRAFLSRAVRFCVDAGVTQFLDLGSGIPTLGNVHETAQRADPAARVAYVDIDPVAVLHSEALLAGNDLATIIQADLYQPERLLADPQLRQLLDLSRPVALLMVAVLHYLPDADDPAGIIERYRRALAPGSFLIISHACDEGLAAGQLDQFLAVYEKCVAPIVSRQRGEVAALFGGFELVEPGVVAMAQWRPDPADQSDLLYGYAGVGRLP